MRGMILAASFAALTACGGARNAAPPELAGAQTWFICPASEAPVIFVATAPDAGGMLSFAEFDVDRGRFARVQQLSRGDEQAGGAGDVDIPLLADAELAATVRMRGEADPAQDWTPPIRSVSVGGQTFSCSVSPRTRLLAFDGEELVRATRGDDGALVLTRTPHGGAPAHFRAGREEAGRSSITLIFDAGEQRFVLYAPNTAPATLNLWRAGQRVGGTEYLARIVGDDPDAWGAPVR